MEFEGLCIRFLLSNCSGILRYKFWRNYDLDGENVRMQTSVDTNGANVLLVLRQILTSATHQHKFVFLVSLE